MRKEQKMDVWSVARVVHAALREYESLTHGDDNPPWDELSDEIRWAYIHGVLNVNERADITPEELHENWVENKLRHGWTYGLVKNFLTKTHPCLVPYEELSTVEKGKAILFIAVAKTLLRML